MEVYAAVQRFVFIEGNSRQEAARGFGLSRETVLKMCRFSLPPGYTRTKPVAKPKLGPLLPVIAAILDADLFETATVCELGLVSELAWPSRPAQTWRRECEVGRA